MRQAAPPSGGARGTPGGHAGTSRLSTRSCNTCQHRGGRGDAVHEGRAFPPPHGAARPGTSTFRASEPPRPRAPPSRPPWGSTGPWRPLSHPGASPSPDLHFSKVRRPWTPRSSPRAPPLPAGCSSPGPLFTEVSPPPVSPSFPGAPAPRSGPSSPAGRARTHLPSPESGSPGPAAPGTRQGVRTLRGSRGARAGRGGAGPLGTQLRPPPCSTLDSRRLRAVGQRRACALGEGGARAPRAGAAGAAGSRAARRPPPGEQDGPGVLRPAPRRPRSCFTTQRAAPAPRLVARTRVSSPDRGGRDDDPRGLAGSLVHVHLNPDRRRLQT